MSSPPPLVGISIHALRVEGDTSAESLAQSEYQFLSTPSVWRATAAIGGQMAYTAFLSTPSVWRATYQLDVDEDDMTFLSTPSVWRATVYADGQNTIT